MDRFQRTGAGSGVGLAGIRERIKELGGDFTISSTDGGTTLRSAVPLSSKKSKTAAEPIPEGRDVPASGANLANLAVNANRVSR